MHYQKITPISITDGIGCRVVLWVSGLRQQRSEQDERDPQNMRLPWNQLLESGKNTGDFRESAALIRNKKEELYS